MVLPILAAIASAGIAANSANRAADLQNQRSQDQIDLSERIYEENVERFAPYTEFGNNALTSLASLMSGDEEYTPSTGFQFALDQGVSAVDNSAASGGNLFSGATMKAVQDRATGIGTQFYQNDLANLFTAANMGQAAAGNQANASTNHLSTATNALTNMGNASSAAAIATGNALTNGIGNVVGLYGYQNGLNNSSAGSTGSWF